MPGMSTPSVIENRIELEPVTSDTFVADLTEPHGDGRGAALLALAAGTPRRRIYD
jgi:hypothetical protein